MPYVTFVPQAPMGESADPGIFVQGTHVPAPLVERSGVWIKTAGSAILLQQNYRLSNLRRAAVAGGGRRRVDL